MRFKYTGSQKEITFRGVTFKKGTAKEVKDESLAYKLSLNPDFTQVKDGKNKK